jgi:GNAT superfamily N-acetyltransferase
LKDILIRKVDRTDSPSVGKMVWALLSELFPDLYNADQLQASVDDILGRSSDVFVFMAEENDKAVGLITLNSCTAIYALGDFGEISELYVAPRFRSSGLGARLIATAVDFGLTKGWTMLEVGAPDVPRWQRTVDFYKRNGFKEVGPRLYLPLSENSVSTL